jgi:cytidylate kinase
MQQSSGRSKAGAPATRGATVMIAVDMRKEIQMATNITNSISTQLRPVFAALRAAQGQEQHESQAQEGAPAAFVTISRQPGISTDRFTGALAEHLNAISPGWKVWDRELVEKVAADYHISRGLVEAVGRTSKSWLEEFIQGLAIAAGDPDEQELYRRVGMTVRALAQAGKAIIIGRGAINITSNMPGGVHVRLVAPWGYRVWRLAGELGISRDEAAQAIEELEREREMFYRHYWQHRPPSSEMFSITLNVVAGDDERLAECVLPLLEAAKTRAARQDEHHLIAQ